MNYADYAQHGIVLETRIPPRTSWWTVAEDGERFTRAAAQAHQRMKATKSVKLPDTTHLHHLRRGGR